jgi:hypothetical protein
MHRRVTESCRVPWCATVSCASVLHQRGNPHELDTRDYAVETCYTLQKRVGKKALAASSESQT